MSWEEKKLGELVDLTQGFAINKKSKHFVVDEGLPLLRITDMINRTQAVFIKEEIPKKFIAKPEDIIYTRTGQVGLVFRNQFGVIHNNCFTVKPINGELSKEYLYWFLRDPEIKRQANTLAAGAAQPDLPHGSFKSISIKYPKKITTQKKIASILSTYDELIENNLKRIQLLEEAAQHLYKEWFVNFRFPGSEKVSFDKETGLPEGWDRINLLDIAEIRTGYSFKAKDFNDQKIGKPAIRIRDIPNHHTNTYTTEEVDEKYLVEQGDILIGMDGFFYTDIWCGQKGVLVQRVCRLRSNEPKLQGFLLAALMGPIKFYEKTITGATVAHLGMKHLKEIFINVPQSQSFKSELEIFNRLNQQKITLHNSIRILKEARDLLLPRLMNRAIEL